jgi:hypothetical protein
VVLSGKSAFRRRTLVAVIALTASAIVAPVAGWSDGFALGSTPQTITFGALTDRTLNQSALVVTASATSGLSVLFHTNTPSVCSSTGTNGATISPITTGTCTVQAEQGGDATWEAATSVQQSFLVSKGSQTITFGSLANVTLGHLPIVVSATASTGFTVTFTTTTPTVCTSSGATGATITIVAAGTCTVRADQAGNTIFDPAPPVSRSFTVSKAAQAITFGALADKTTLQSPVTVSATASSLLAVTFSTTTPATCTSSGTNGTTINLIAAGTCTVQADQAGNATYKAAPSVTRSFTVARAPQTIQFAPLGDRTAVQSPFAVSASASSGLAVTFSATTPAVCTASGTGGATITLVGAGTCTVLADQAGNAVYNAAFTISESFTVTKADQTIAFGALASRSVLLSPLAVSATATSNLPVTFSSTTLAVCTAGGANGASITLLVPGTCTIHASQAGNAAYYAALSVPQSFNVTKADQTIAFGTLTNTPLGPPRAVGAAASSGLSVSFSTTTPTVCTPGGTNGATITLLTEGTCTVRAEQSGDSFYNPAPFVDRSFGVGKTDQTIAFAALPAVALTHPTVTVAAPATSGLPVVFSTTTPAVCTAGGTNGTVVQLVAAGTCTVHADQPGNAEFNAAPSVARSFAVAKADQSIAFAAPAGITLPHAPVTVKASATSHLVVTFSTTTPTVCRTGGTNGAKVTAVGAGTCVVRADQVGNAIFNAALRIARTFIVKTPVLVQRERSGYWMLGADGHVYAFGGAPGLGNMSGPAVALAARRDGTGYWVVDAAGNVRAFGRAAYRGGRPALSVGDAVSTLSGTPSGNGYWLFTKFGRSFAYGDARFYGDMGGVHLNGPIVASTATPTGRGYYMVGSDGGVFSFGDARFHGSMGGSHLNRPIVGLSPTPDNRGYWLVASDGGVFAFDAPFRGSLGRVALNKPVNGLVAYGNGYLMVASDGGVFDFADKPFVGSLGGTPPAAPIIGIAAFVA